MKLLILGATGSVGAHLLEQSLLLGHTVTALVRDQKKLESLHHPNLRIVLGDALNSNSITQAVEGQHAVLYTLGASVATKSTTFFSDTTRLLIEAMTAHQIQRLIAVTGIGAGDSKGHGGWLYNNIIYPLFTKNIYQDKDRQEALIQASTLDWTIVRPAPFTNGPLGGKLRATDQLTGIQMSAISRADTAAFLLEQLTSQQWRHKTPLVGY